MVRHTPATLIDDLSRLVPAIFLLLFAACVDAQVTLTRGTNFAVTVAADGGMSFDLHGRIWVIPADGGVARQIPASPPAARRPQWAPGGDALVFQARAGNQEQLWLYRTGAAEPENISVGQFYDHQPSWHPGGQRIVFSSDRRETGFDLWELDLATGLAWRLSSLAGDETEPAWSASGEDLVYIHSDGERWSLMLRRRGQPDQVLESSTQRLSNPSWRPDGSLITVLRHGEDGISIDMVILSDPLLIRPLIEDEDFFIAPVAWRDRQQMVYAANGLIRKRAFNSWSSRNVPFRATVYAEQPRRSQPVRQRQLPVFDEPGGTLVVRVARLLDGLGGGYRDKLDIVVQGSRIVAVEPPVERPGAIVIDMGDLTALPGLIDASAKLPADVDESLGPLMLAFGVTTVVADTEAATTLGERWSGKDMPGPRVLGGDWQPQLDWLASVVIDSTSLPTSPMGIRYEDGRLDDAVEPVAMLSGLADSRTPGLAALLQSRQARLLKSYPTAMRRFISAPPLAAQATSIVLGSRANGLAPGVATHAELRALADAGLDNEHVLRTAGINASSALGLGLSVGRIAPGASADILLVDGDPLNDIGDTLKIVGVVRNGRFFSAIGLIERFERGQHVE